MVRRLKDDAFARPTLNGPSGALSAGRGHSGAAIVSFSLAAVALLALSRLDHSLVRGVRVLLADAATPALAAVLVPLRPVQNAVRTVGNLMDAREEADRLREENQRLKGWEARAREMERRLADVETLVKIVPEQPLAFRTARVVADTGGPFIKIALIDAGRDAGFRSGYPAVNADGLVGRLISTAPRSSRLLLLNDLNSRVPVYIGAKSVRAVMAGDQGPYPKLAHIPLDAKIEVGDEVVTSGVGGVFPRGLRIGTVVDTGDQLRVELHARLDRLEYVSVLLFDAINSPQLEDEPLIDKRPSARKRGGTADVSPQAPALAKGP
jgi:rod shape-determining protein MreC